MRLFVKREVLFTVTFCKKSKHEVRFLISGPEASYICERCVEICSEIIRKKIEEESDD